MKRLSWWEPDDGYDPDSEPVTKTFEEWQDEYMKQHHPEVWRWMKEVGDGLNPH